MKKLLRTLVILILLACAFLLIKKNTTRFNFTNTGSAATGAMATGDTFESNRFFAVEDMDGVNIDREEIEIFDKNDLSAPYKIVALPTPTEGSGRYVLSNYLWGASPVFFENTGIYVLGYFAEYNESETSPSERGTEIFYITMNGAVSKIGSIKNMSLYTPNAIIDQKNGKVIWLDTQLNDWCTIKVFDIASATETTFNKDNLPLPQKAQCETKTRGYAYFLSTKNNSVDVILDRVEVDYPTPQARVLTIDIQANQVMSDISFSQHEQNNRIVYTGDCRPDVEPCNVYIDGKDMGISPAYLRSFVNENTLFGITSTAGFVFVTLEELQLKK